MQVTMSGFLRFAKGSNLSINLFCEFLGLHSQRLALACSIGKSSGDTSASTRQLLTRSIENGYMPHPKVKCNRCIRQFNFTVKGRGWSRRLSMPIFNGLANRREVPHPIARTNSNHSWLS